MNTASLILGAFKDLFLQKFSTRKQAEGEYHFGFLIHPRGNSDVFKKYPFLRFLPSGFLRFFLLHFWPVTVSKITGLKSLSGEKITGYVFSIPLTAVLLLEHRALARKRIAQAIYLARAKGVRLVGLGGLTSSVTGGGLDLIERSAGVSITTGHAYTAYNVTSNVFALSKRYNIDPTKARVAIVGAAGSIGEGSARILARAGYQNLLLVDLPRKRERFETLKTELSNLHSGVTITLSHQIGDIKTADFIIAATNAPEALITSVDVKPGAIIIDDAQPSDVADDVLERDDVLAIEAGVVHTEGITTNFNMGLKHREDNFCCLAEVLILASEKRDSHYVIHRATLEHIDEIAEKGKKLGFTIASFQNRKETISDAKMREIESLIARNGIQL